MSCDAGFLFFSNKVCEDSYVRHCWLTFSDAHHGTMKHTRRLALAGRPEALVLSMTVTGVVVGVLSHLHTQRSFKLLCSIDPGLANPLPLHVNTAASVEPFLRSRDAAAGPLRPGCHSEVTWHGAEEEPTRISVLHLHGWSASPLEIDPVDARLATNLRANLLRFRLSGHGLASADGYELYANATRATLLRDVAQAFACGRLLGRRVLLIASSTGATLCLWLCAQPLWANDVVGLVALSPALALRARSYHALKYLVALLPAAASEWLFRAIVGREFRINVSGAPGLPPPTDATGTNRGPNSSASGESARTGRRHREAASLDPGVPGGGAAPHRRALPLL